MRGLQEVDVQTMVILAPDYVDARVLEANVAETHNVPTGAVYCVFSATDNFYVNFTTTATVPGADVTTGVGSFLNPGTMKIQGLTSFSLISPTAAVVTMAFFK